MYILIFIIILFDVGLLLYHPIMRLEQNNICAYTYAYIILLLNHPQVRKRSFLCAKNKLQTHRFNLLKNTALCKCCHTIYRVTCKSINSIRSRHTHYCYTVRTRRRRFDLVLGWPTNISEVGIYLPVYNIISVCGCFP